VTSPASLWAIIIGDAAASALFGIVLSLIPLTMGYALTGSVIVDPSSLCCGIVLGALAFSALGILIASRATDTPSEIMMLANLVRLPLIFISGVFVPLPDMPEWGQRFAPISPLSYAADLIRIGMGGNGYFPPWLDVSTLVVFACALMFCAHLLHRRAQRAG
jgi:ABC-2 type transport system permease protein